jgi:membrane protease YdiL (CAAX protease family)
MQTYLKSRPAWIQLVIFLGLAFSVLIVFTQIGEPILRNLTGIKTQLQDMKQWENANPALITFVRGMLVLQFLGLFLIPALVFAWPEPVAYLGLKAPDKNRYWIFAVVIMIVAIPMVEYLGMLNQKISLGGSTQQWMKSMEENAAKQIRFMLKEHTLSELIKNLVFIALFAGIGEELFFRGVLQRLLIKAFGSPWAGIVVTAFLFSAFHFQFFGFFPRFLLGILLGAIYWYSGSLWPAIIAHFIYDGLIIVLAYLDPSMIQNPDKPLMNPSSQLMMTLVSAVLTGLILWQMKQSSDKK